MKTIRKNYRIYIIAMIGLCIIALGEYSVYSSFKEALYYSNQILFHLFAISLFVFPLLLIATTFVGFRYFSQIGSYLYAVSTIWLGFLVYLFMGGVFLALYIWLNYFLKIPISIHIIGIDLFAIANILLVYGVWNAFNLRLVNREIKASTLLNDWTGKKIILVSDTHLGHMQRSKFSKKLIEIIKKEEPDLVLHTGDIIDGPVFNYRESFEHFESLNPPLGFFYTEGNHERYSRDYDSFRKAFPTNITDLTDSKTIVNNTQIIGLSFRQNETKEETKKRLGDLGYDKSKPSIILLHDPKNSAALADLGVSMVVSGHTHGGQFFPDNVIVRAIYKSETYGVTYTKDSVAITTSGTGMTLIPMRIGTNPEIVIIKIV